MTPYLQAVSGVVIPLNVAIALFLDVPVGIAFITFLPAVTALVTFVFELVGLHDFGKQYGLRVRFVHYLKLDRRRPLLPGAPRRRRRPRRVARATGPQRLGVDQPRRRAPHRSRSGPPAPSRPLKFAPLPAVRSVPTSPERTFPRDLHPSRGDHPTVPAQRPPAPKTGRPLDARSRRAFAHARAPTCCCAACSSWRSCSCRAGTSPTTRPSATTRAPTSPRPGPSSRATGLAHYTYWYDHPPLGWIQIAAADLDPRP